MMRRIKTMLLWALRRGQTKAFIRDVADTTSRLSKFNAIWKDAFENVPFYTEWKQKYNLPDAITSIAELTRWPILEKQDLILNKDKLIRKDVLRFCEYVTGGGSGEPLYFRTMAGEGDAPNMNKWMGWARMGIYPDSRCFLLWGHRHLYGRGFNRRVKFAVRKFKDWLTNNLRADATDLSVHALKNDVKKIIKFKPTGIIAYSSSLLALVRSCGEYRERCRHIGVRAVICTAGSLAKSERAEISEFFNAPVGMEYGSMEAGVMAYQTPATGGRYEVFGATNILHSVPESVTGCSQVLVTKLYRCYLPLIRYRICDCVTEEEIDDDGAITGFSEVLGRTGDIVDVGNGVCFHGLSFMVCAQAHSQIIAYQLRVSRARHHVTFVAQTIRPLTDEDVLSIVKHAAYLSGLAESSISVVESPELVKAPSGKIRLVIETS